MQTLQILHICVVVYLDALDEFIFDLVFDQKRLEHFHMRP